MEEGTLLLFVAPVSVFPAIPDSNSVFSFFLFFFFFFFCTLTASLTEACRARSFPGAQSWEGAPSQSQSPVAWGFFLPGPIAPASFLGSSALEKLPRVIFT